MTRWTISIHPDYLVEDPNGLWVDYRDHATALAAKDAEIERLRKALDGMRFAYTNKDADAPHDFETSALAEASRLLDANPIARAAVEGP